MTDLLVSIPLAGALVCCGVLSGSPDFALACAGIAGALVAAGVAFAWHHRLMRR